MFITAVCFMVLIKEKLNDKWICDLDKVKVSVEVVLSQTQYSEKRFPSFFKEQLFYTFCSIY